MREIDGKRMLSTKEAAEFLQLSEATLRYWRHLGDARGPKSFRLGPKLVYYSIDDLDEWMAEQYESSVTA